jgi:penicillin amidase
MQRDLYVERLDPTGPDRYLDGVTWRPLEHRCVEISIRDESPHQLDIRFAHGRPIVDHLVAEAALPRKLWPPERGANTALSLAWVGFEVSDEPKAFLDLSRAGSVADGRRALAQIRCPTWNYVLADSAGAIGYQCTGAIPLRGRTYRGYRDANDPADAWVGYIPFEGLPRLDNPERGWVGSANNPTAPSDFPYPLFGTWTVEDRAARIETLLDRRAAHTPSTFREMQNDVFSGRAARGVPSLVAMLESSGNPRFAEPARLLNAWNHDLTVESAAASIYFVFFWRWHQHVLRRRFPEELATLVQDAGWGLSGALLHGDPSGWFASERKRLEIMTVAMDEALDWLEQRLGDDANQWEWGKIHRLGATHPAARTELHHEFLDIAPRPHPGGPGVLCSSIYSPGSFDTRIGPIYRFIASLDPDARTETISWPGQSGHPGSPHYADQVERQVVGEYAAFPIVWEDVVAQATSETRLHPTG